MITLALDQSSLLTGWAIFDGTKLKESGVFELKKSLDEATRLVKIREWLISLLNKYQPELIALEDLSSNVNFITTRTLGHVQGVIIETCKELGYKYQIVPVTSWRPHCGVKGKVRADLKKSMQNIVKQKFNMDVTDDEADAIGIGMYATSTNVIVNWE